MRLNLNLKNKYDLKINGIILIGAHYGNEYNDFLETDVKNVVMFEPLKNNFSVLSKNIIDQNVVLINKALGNENKKITMFVETANKGMSSSILEPKLHINQYPHIVFNEREEIDMVRLDDVGLDMNKYNFILIDVQGYEMEVFKGAEETLKNIDYIITEINNVELYKDCVMFSNLVSYLSNFGFVLMEEDAHGATWGDALFIKRKYD
jgi:FkbM family methyltransferase